MRLFNKCTQENETKIKELLKTDSSDIEADKVSEMYEYEKWHQHIKNKHFKLLFKDSQNISLNVFQIKNSKYIEIVEWK